MLIYANQRENDGVDLFIYLFFFFASKEAYPIVRQLEKNNGLKSASESSKNARKTNLGSLGTPTFVT